MSDRTDERVRTFEDMIQWGERFLTRIGAKERAEAERDAAVADRDRIARSIPTRSERPQWGPDDLWNEIDRIRAALAGREGSDDA